MVAESPDPRMPFAPGMSPTWVQGSDYARMMLVRGDGTCQTAARRDFCSADCMVRDFAGDGATPLRRKV
jgi:hypothetical protein